MSDQWGVLIGVAGTLLGASLTGGFSLMQGRQATRDRERDRLEQRWLVHREARRDAYLKLVAKHYELGKVIELLWVSPHNDNGQLFKDADAVEVSLVELATVVRLEGPPSVGGAAHNLAEANANMIFALRGLDHRAAGQGESARLFDVVTRSAEEVEEKRHEALTAFIDAARVAIGGEAGDWEPRGI